MAGVHKQCMTRLQKEYKSLLKEPVPNITAHPSPSNLLEWHYVLEGAKGTEYEGGVYHGKLTFPPEYPFKPPSISLFTPNGRFATNTKLCLSMTDFHPESWNPMWSVGTILTGLLSFMYDSQATTGSIITSRADKERMARESLGFNAKNATFRKLFPGWVEEHARRQAVAAQPSPAPAPAAPVASSGGGGGGGRATGEGGGQEGEQEAATRAEGADGGARTVGAGAQHQQQERRGAQPQPPPLSNAILTVAIVVVVLAAVWVSSGGAGSGEVLRSWGWGPAAGSSS